MGELARTAAQTSDGQAKVLQHLDFTIEVALLQ